MKRFIALILICLPICTSAQLPELRALGTKHYLTNDVTVTHLEGDMLKTIMKEEADLITSIDVIASTNAVASSEIFDEATAIMGRYNIEPMIKTDSNEVSAIIYTIKAQGVVTDIIAIVKQAENGVVTVISGNIPEEKLNDYVQVAM